MNRKNLKLAAIIVAIITLLVVGLAVGLDVFAPNETVMITPTPTALPTTAPLSEDATFAEKQAFNSEYLGELAFESGLVSESLVQADDNEKYYDLAWNLENSSSGAAFFDYRNTLDDQNLIVYGHFVYADETKMFSPLHQLKEEENYEANKTITIELETQIREYVVVRVFYYEMDDDSLRFFIPNYNTQTMDDQYYTTATEEYFDEYMAAVDEASFYSIDEDLTIEDNWLTLQTCVRDRDDLRLIVLAKEVSREAK